MLKGNGKIANLPAEIRDELNYRLTEGEPGNELVEWLNSKPEVAQVIRERFDGTPISEQNLSEWRKRGYQKWLALHNILDESDATSDNAEVIAATGIDCDKLLLTLTGAYADMIQNWLITPPEEMTYKLAVYKNLTNAVINLRRGEIQKIRLEIERERLELLREKRRSQSASEPVGRGAGGMSRKEASLSSPKSSSAETGAPDDPSLRSPVSALRSPPSPPKPENTADTEANDDPSGESPRTTKGSPPTANPPTQPMPPATPPKPAAPQAAKVPPTPQLAVTPSKSTPGNHWRKL